MRKIIFLYLNFLFISSSYAVYGFKACSEREISSLIDYTSRAHELIDNWKFELNRNKYQKLSFAHRSKISIGKKVLNCIDTNLDELVYRCNALKSDEGYDAKTIPIFTREVKLNEHFFIRNLDKTKIGIIIHEASHKCGTTDAAYFRGSVAHSTKYVPWSLIGDTYEYWVKEGFCLPDVDC